MQAIVLEHIGGPASSSLQLRQRPIPTPKPGQVLIRIKAFGLNHSELAVRLGEPNPAMGAIPLPRVLGIECVGLVEDAPGEREAELPRGTVVMAALGGMGLFFDGSYAEYCVAPAACVIPVASSEQDLKLSWEVLGALPEMLQTAHGTLFRALRLKANEKLLIRGGTSSVGLTAIALAKHAGAHVIATTRSPAKEALLKDAGADDVIVDTTSSLLSTVQAIHAQGVDKLLDLVGASTVKNSLLCLASGGVCCVAGTLGGMWMVESFVPIMHVPMDRYLTGYAERTFRRENAPWDQLVELIGSGELKIKAGRVFRGLESVVQAHEVLERDEAGGKVVVVV